MDPRNLKRRRPYTSEDPAAEPVLHGSIPSVASSAVDIANFTPTNDFILQQAASVLNVPVERLLHLPRYQERDYILGQAARTLHVTVDNLLDLSRQQHQTQGNKRLRLDLDVAMPSQDPPISAAQCKSEKAAVHDPRHLTDCSVRRSQPELPQANSLFGWANSGLGSQLADCFASFSVCQPSSGYEAQSNCPTSAPMPSPFGYADNKAYTDESPPAVHRQSSTLPAVSSEQAGTVNFFVEADPEFARPYLPSYPSLQPSRGPRTQPTTSREAMCYPETPQLAPCFDSAVSHASRAAPLSHSARLAGHVDYTAGIMTLGEPSEFATRQADANHLMPSYSQTTNCDRSDSLSLIDSSRIHLQTNATNPEFVFPNQRPPAAKRGPFKDHVERQKTANTRKIGSCIRCRMQRIRCNADPGDEKGICLTCKKVSANKIWRLPCLRLKINDVLLSKPGQVQGYEWTLRWKENHMFDEIDNWASSDIKTIRVTEGYTGNYVELRVRQFVPQDGDKLERSWVTDKGETKCVEIPPYALVDLDNTRTAYSDYIKRGLVECCKRILGPREKLLWQTYGMALKLATDPKLSTQERNLLTSTLDLWMSIRLTTKSFEIVGDERLGMSEDVMDETSPLPGKIPLPPVMGAQLDMILIHQIQTKLRHDTLELLQKMTQENKQRTWLTTYLVTFILLHNIALVIRHDASYARKHGLKRRFAREDRVKQYYQGATTLLAYFHYCNKGVFPFSTSCKPVDLRNLAELDDSAVQFVHYTRRYAAEHRKQWEDVWECKDYENDYFFVSQLFEQNWLPRTMD